MSLLIECESCGDELELEWWTLGNDAHQKVLGGIEELMNGNTRGNSGA